MAKRPMREKVVKEWEGNKGCYVVNEDFCERFSGCSKCPLNSGGKLTALFLTTAD